MPFRTLAEEDFIGRERELGSLYRISSELRKGIAASIFLSGQNGIGKTELLSQMFTALLRKQDEVAPFFYTVNPALVSAEDFSMDYLSRFVRQRLAFQKKDTSLIHADELSLEDLMRLAEKSDEYWVVDIIGRYLHAKTAGDPEKLFLCAISAPYYSFLSSGIPVIIIIDEFQRAREFYRSNPGDSKNMWVLFEELIKSNHVLHIITGARAELQNMFFQETSLGKSLELISLSVLDKNASLRVFTSLCRSYNIHIDKEPLQDFVDLFRGNPFYIRNFIQTLRHTREPLSLNNLRTIYFNEIINGKIYTYWVSRLKKYISKLEFRKASLELLYNLCHKSPSTLSGIADALSTERNDFNYIVNKYLSKSARQLPSIGRQDLYDIVKIFQSAGIIEAGFNTLEILNDETLINVIKGLYRKDVLGEPLSDIETKFVKEASGHETKIETPSFEVIIPAAPRAELIAARTLEEIAKNLKIPGEVIGQLQTALIDLLTTIITQEKPDSGNFHIRFKCTEEKFIIEVQTPFEELASFTSSDAIPEDQLIKAYFDDIKFEKTRSGMKIILFRSLKKSLTPAS